jgi:hypothetical protein
MKSLSKMLVIILFFAVIILGFSVTTRAEVKDMGEFCFEMQPVVSVEGIGGQLRVGVLSFGSGHLILDGTIVPKFSFAPTGHVHGSATLEGNKVTMSLTSSEAALDINVSLTGQVAVLHAVIDATTLYGDWSAMISDFVYQNPNLTTASPRILRGPIFPCAD